MASERHDKSRERNLDIVEFSISGTPMTSTAGELNALAGSGIVVADATKLHAVTASAAEINQLAGQGAVTTDFAKLHALTASAAEVNAATGQPASVTTTATPATGTCGVQFVFKDAQGVTISKAFAGTAYFSDSTGLALGAVTGGAVLTNGMWQDTVAGKTAVFCTTAAGLLGVTVTSAGGSRYITFILPNGTKITSTVLTVN